MKQNTVRKDKSDQQKAGHVGPGGQNKGFEFYSKTEIKRDDLV